MTRSREALASPPHENVQVTEDGRVGAYISLVVVSELNRWEDFSVNQYSKEEHL